jgi:hypothetical protein
MFTSPLKRLRQKSWLDAIPDTMDAPESGIDTAISAAARDLEGGK